MLVRTRETVFGKWRYHVTIARPTHDTGREKGIRTALQNEQALEV